MKHIKLFESFVFNPKDDEEKIKYVLIYKNTYNGDTTTLSISLGLEEALQSFLRNFIKTIKDDWGAPKNYFSEAFFDDNLKDQIYESIDSWKDFFNAIKGYDDDDLVNGSYTIEIRNPKKGYDVMNEIQCLKKIFKLDSNVLNTYLPFS